ncbi:hypothetical protein H6783_01900 [Candidatus Nomurabacteria bacterium]|nr:hypothetical protein [Candidatus Nomurabacteria bacterium]
MSKINNLQKNIMRRVYYTFGLRLATHTITLHIVMLLVAGYALAKLVHVAAIFNNVMNLRVGELGRYIVGTLTHTDLLTLVVFGLLVFTGLSLQWRLLVPRARMVRLA